MTATAHTINLVEPDPLGRCTRRTQAGELVLDPCTDCGHTNLVHPGRHNPALSLCAICAVIVAAGRGDTRKPSG